MVVVVKEDGVKSSSDDSGHSDMWQFIKMERYQFRTITRIYGVKYIPPTLTVPARPASWFMLISWWYCLSPSAQCLCCSRPH